MSYNPPSNDSVDVSGSRGYSPPSNDSVDLSSLDGYILVEGDRLDTVVTVNSTFTNQQTQTIELRIEDGGTTVHTDTQDVTLANNSDSQQITLSWQTASGDAGTYDMFIESENDTIIRPVVVTA